MKSNTFYKTCLIPLILLSLLLSACGQSKTEQGADPNASEQLETTPETEVESQPSGYIAPLTGLPTDQPVTDRPIAVMINNMAKARPQSGLTHADIVYEVLAEGGITRLVAIFQSDRFQDAIGPIRSIRPYLIDLGESYHGVLVHAGASNDAYAILQKQRKEHLDEITNAGTYFWRDKSRKAPHNLYSNLEKLREGADKKKYKKDEPLTTYPFAKEDDVPIGTDASKITLNFLLKNYTVTYDYDTESKLYKRSINGEPHIDLNSKEQLSATNVVVLGADHRTLDDVGRLSVDLHKGGEAILFQRGKEIICTWQRTNPNDVIRLYKDGQELPLYAGKTYYNIVPNQPTFGSHVKVE
ncbi:hypothetical protein BVG16_28605 [Paenibacillus selenitireducens]|jgi:hypothetical protein|uniref:Lipoprotein YerB n=1 Tax=Paenibacillus selenitireducens TaxID=1324314 RepID=A0A1T2X0K8_9BACL|nr:DUF3048 domain-containing protein [Paenibacillus selenitireducens]OPA73434.1 hypothetical protein BVG16_28605 [Paenibacillus selenitireducens]